LPRINFRVVGSGRGPRGPDAIPWFPFPNDQRTATNRDAPINHRPQTTRISERSCRLNRQGAHAAQIQAENFSVVKTRQPTETAHEIDAAGHGIID
jgi:hypothetical protein